MMRMTLLISLGGLLLVLGIRQGAADDSAQKTPPAAEAKKDAPAKEPGDAAKAEGKPAADGMEKGEVLMAPPPPPGAPAPVKTRIVRALLDALNGIQGLEPEHKDGVTRSLLDADQELSRVLGGNSKRLILRANRKPPVLVIGESAGPKLVVPEQPMPPPKAGLVPPPASPPVVPGAIPTPAPASPATGKQTGKQAMIQSLLKTLDEMPGEDPQAKEELRKILLETEKKLNQAPGGQP